MNNWTADPSWSSSLKRLCTVGRSRALAKDTENIFIINSDRSNLISLRYHPTEWYYWLISYKFSCFPQKKSAGKLQTCLLSTATFCKNNNPLGVETHITCVSSNLLARLKNLSHAVRLWKKLLRSAVFEALKEYALLEGEGEGKWRKDGEGDGRKPVDFSIS